MGTAVAILADRPGRRPLVRSIVDRRDEQKGSVVDESDQPWSSAELDRWFQDVVGGADGLFAVFDGNIVTASPLETQLVIYGVHERRGQTFENDDLRDFRAAWSAIRRDWNSPDAVWEALSTESKASLRRGWEQRAADIAAADAAAAWEEDSIVPELAGDLLRDDPAAAETGRRPPTLVLAAGAALAILALIVIGLGLTSGDDDAPTSLDSGAGSDSGGPVAVAFLVNGGRGSYLSGADLPANQAVTLEIDFTDDDGNPIVGRTFAVTIGRPPDGPDAVHAEAVTDERGRASFELTTPGPGTSTLYCFDGTDVNHIAAVVLY